jgi:glycosyltransferase involved in cell wall biosynthesis
VYPLISVIIPVYNAGAYIKRAIASVNSQSYDNIEIILINDGSTDNSLQILEPLLTEKITLFTQKNAGASSARNKGMELAKGTYIAFLDADDYWHKNKIKIQYEQMKEHPDWNSCFSLVTRISNQNFNSSIIKPIISETHKLIDIFQSPYLGTSSFMISKDALDLVGFFDESLETAEDIDFFLRTAKFGNVGKINAFLVFKEVIDESLGNKITSYQDNLDVINSFLDSTPTFLQSNNTIVKNVQRKVYGDWCSDLIYRRYLTDAARLLSKNTNMFTFPQLVKYYLKVALLKVSGKNQN